MGDKGPACPQCGSSNTLSYEAAFAAGHSNASPAVPKPPARRHFSRFAAASFLIFLLIFVLRYNSIPAYLNFVNVIQPEYEALQQNYERLEKSRDDADAKWQREFDEASSRLNAFKEAHCEYYIENRMPTPSEPAAVAICGLIALASLIWAIVSAYKASVYNKTDYLTYSDAWRHSWVCRKCGRHFYKK